MKESEKTFCFYMPPWQHTASVLSMQMVHNKSAAAAATDTMNDNEQEDDKGKEEKSQKKN